MRDKERIDPILEKLGEIWKANPDWRLGQLVSNIANSPLAVPANDRYSIYYTSRVDPFHVEDVDMEAFMDKMIVEKTPPIPVHNDKEGKAPSSNLEEFLKGIDDMAPLLRPTINVLVKRIEKAFEDHFPRE